MPESVTDRNTKAHEYIFLLSKNQRYYFNQESILQPVMLSSTERISQKNASWRGSSFDRGKTGEMMDTHGGTRKSGNKERKPPSERGVPKGGSGNQAASVPWEGSMANKRSVWTVTTKPFKEAHFATFPQDLIVDCIKAGCPEGGIVCDMFAGAGTTPIVARKLNRNFYAGEPSAAYLRLAEKRMYDELGFFT
jgi:DNA modification methylase